MNLLTCAKATLLIALLSSSAFAQTKNAEEELQSLIIKWKARDGDMVGELSYEFSKKVVMNGKIFFKVFLGNQEDFNSWIEDLQFTTFTAYQSSDNVEDALYSAYYNELKVLMLKESEKYLDHPQFGKMAHKLKSKLGKIYVRIID